MDNSSRSYEIQTENITQELVKESVDVLCNFRSTQQETYHSINVLFQLYEMNQNGTAIEPWQVAAKSMQSFLEFYAPEIDSDSFNTFLRNLTSYSPRDFRDSAGLTLNSRGNDIHRLYLYKPGEYCLIEEERIASDYINYTYCRIEVINSFKDYLDQKASTLIIPSRTMYHATQSSAIPGILRQRVILSAIKAVEKGEVLLTGENATFAKMRGFGNYGEIYVDSDPISCLGYSKNPWFDQYSIVFGIDKTVHRPRVANSTDPTDRYVVGDEVNLNSINVIFAPFSKVVEVRNMFSEWEIEVIPIEFIGLAGFVRKKAYDRPTLSEAQRAKSYVNELNNWFRFRMYHIDGKGNATKIT